MKNIIIYSTPNCHFCHMAKEFLQEKGIQYTEHNVQSDLEKRQEMVDRSGQLGVPVIIIGNDLIVGFDQEKVEKLLEI